MRIGFVGGGVMGEAILSGVLKRKIAAPAEVTVGEVLAPRRAQLQQQFGIKAVAENQVAVQQADVVILAIKPQHLHDVLTGLRGRLLPGQTVLSIVAGAPIEKIAAGLDYRAIVRAMPNTPGQIGAGITAWTATPEVGAREREAARSILAALGEEVYLEDEDLIDVATALSGSGPAYVFLFIEALVEAGVYLGMSRDVAHRLAVHTVAGSGRMAVESGVHPAILRERVTSPGGTTAEALLALEDAGFRSGIINAVTAAYDKALDLAEEDDE